MQLQTHDPFQMGVGGGGCKCFQIQDPTPTKGVGQFFVGQNIFALIKCRLEGPTNIGDFQLSCDAFPMAEGRQRTCCGACCEDRTQLQAWKLVGGFSGDQSGCLCPGSLLQTLGNAHSFTVGPLGQRRRVFQKNNKSNVHILASSLLGARRPEV